MEGCIRALPRSCVPNTIRTQEKCIHTEISQICLNMFSYLAFRKRRWSNISLHLVIPSSLFSSLFWCWCWCSGLAETSTSKLLPEISVTLSFPVQFSSASFRSPVPQYPLT
ncbi:uncharacterized protein BJX67DRAFT_202880 [Aspergillus lucknowensis]|uniref:Uncharacterized protein n=1 Tax=Aspergillus lucknowensis TaxID=176173 RepID=A0ABR4LMU9_9EURO